VLAAASLINTFGAAMVEFLVSAEEELRDSSVIV
jgi:hypothetical protein